VLECPQNAKHVENQLDLVSRALLSGRKIAFSIAPSFGAAFPELTFGQLRHILRDLGAVAVEETAVGATAVSNQYDHLLRTTERPVISACCPVVVSLIEKYYPDLTSNLAPVVSPMVAHGQILKQKLGQDTFVVFAGPCIAKIAESGLESSANAVDAVVTFDRLRAWLENKQSFNTMKQVPEDGQSLDQPGSSRFFPITGGILKSFTQHDATDTDIITVHGMANCMEVFSCLSQWQISPRFVEALACEGGCIGGPALSASEGLPVRRAKVVDFARQSCGDKASDPAEFPDLTRVHKAQPVIEFLPSDIEIREILIKTGKFSSNDEKNCGACGYGTCREKAIAVWQGLAEVDMCIPYMKTKAESFANLVLDNTLNAIVVVDDGLLIQEFNPAAEKMFVQSAETVKNTHLSRVIASPDVLSCVDCHEKIAARRVELQDRGIIADLMYLPVKAHNMSILIFTDVTDADKQEQDLARMKKETIDKAAEIINRQMHVAQEIAGLLGETTGETKAALLDLVGLLKAKDSR
jgi:iron only hydrogenase large subunit-like protein